MLNLRPSNNNGDETNEELPKEYPMEFLRVLINQHAQTIVALQELQLEVDTIKKEFTTSNFSHNNSPITSQTTITSNKLSSRAQILNSKNGSGSSTANNSNLNSPQHHHGGLGRILPLSSPPENSVLPSSSSNRKRLSPLTNDVWSCLDPQVVRGVNNSSSSASSNNNVLITTTLGGAGSSPTTAQNLNLTTTSSSSNININSNNNLTKIDSGFSGASNATNGGLNLFNSSSNDVDNPLYSLLSFIESKIRTSSSLQNPGTNNGSSPGSEYYHSSSNLGSLDALLGFNRRSSSPSKISTDLKECIRAILNEKNIIELKRQLIFALVRVKAKEDMFLSSKNTLDDKKETKDKELEELERLRYDNEQLKFRLEEMDIELEGTQARFRILSKSLLSQNQKSISVESNENQIQTQTEPIFQNIDISNIHQQQPTLQQNFIKVSSKNKTPTPILPVVRSPPQNNPAALTLGRSTPITTSTSKPVKKLMKIEPDFNFNIPKHYQDQDNPSPSAFKDRFKCDINNKLSDSEYIINPPPSVKSACSAISTNTNNKTFTYTSTNTNINSSNSSQNQNLTKQPVPVFSVSSKVQVRDNISSSQLSDHHSNSNPTFINTAQKIIHQYNTSGGSGSGVIDLNSTNQNQNGGQHHQNNKPLSFSSNSMGCNNQSLSTKSSSTKSSMIPIPISRIKSGSNSSSPLSTTTISNSTAATTSNISTTATTTSVSKNDPTSTNGVTHIVNSSNNNLNNSQSKKVGTNNSGNSRAIAGNGNKALHVQRNKQNNGSNANFWSQWFN